MLITLITLKIRLKLLLRFFLNNRTSGYLRSLEPEFNESTDAIFLELNHFKEAGLPIADKRGYKKRYRANTFHPFFSEINSMLLKYTGIEKVIKKPGKMRDAHLIGNPDKGKASPIINLWSVGEVIDKNCLLELMVKVEDAFKRKLHYLSSGIELLGFMKAKNKQGLLLLWEK